jgi:hypothetical protein
MDTESTNPNDLRHSLKDRTMLRFISVHGKADVMETPKMEKHSTARKTSEKHGTAPKSLRMSAVGGANTVNPNHVHRVGGRHPSYRVRSHVQNDLEQTL